MNLNVEGAEGTISSSCVRVRKNKDSLIVNHREWRNLKLKQ